MRKITVLLLILYAFNGLCQESDSSKLLFLNQLEKELIKEIELKKDSLQKVQKLISETENLLVVENIKQKTGGLFIEVEITKDGKIRSEPTPLSKNYVALVTIGDKVTLTDYESGYWIVKKDNKVGYLSDLYFNVTPEIEAFKERLSQLDKERKEFELTEKARLEKLNEEKQKQKIIDKYGKEVGNKLINGYYWIGMTDDMAEISLGKPIKINKTVGSWGVHEQWIYYNKYLYFENGVLSSYQNTR